MAMAFVKAMARVGVDAVKFQTHLADAESTDRERFRVNVFPQDSTRPDYWRRTAFTKQQWIELADFTREQGLIFLSSPFSELAVEWLEACDVPAWKVASGEIGNTPLLETIAATGKPILVSSGMSSWSELDEAVRTLLESHAPVAVFQCTSAYPCPPETWGLNIVTEMQTKYQCPVGLSDHSGSLTPNLAAVTLGASLLEFHVTFHNEMFGPDVSASLTIEQTADLVKGVRALDVALQAPIDKDEFASTSKEMRALFTKSIVAADDIPEGTTIKREHLDFKKPGDGMPAAEYKSLLGRKTQISVSKDHQFTRKCVE